jgi:hypothetical protein
LGGKRIAVGSHTVRKSLAIRADWVEVSGRKRLSVFADSGRKWCSVLIDSGRKWVTLRINRHIGTDWQRRAIGSNTFLDWFVVSRDRVVRSWWKFLSKRTYSWRKWFSILIESNRDSASSLIDGISERLEWFSVGSDSSRKRTSVRSDRVVGVLRQGFAVKSDARWKRFAVRSDSGR